MKKECGTEASDIEWKHRLLRVKARKYIHSFDRQLMMLFCLPSNESKVGNYMSQNGCPREKKIN